MVPRVFRPAELAALTGALSSHELKRSRAGARHVLALPSVADLAHSTALMKIARGVLGDGALPFRATYFDKSPNSNWLVAWHQDTALPLDSKHETPGWGPWSTKDGVNYGHAPREALQQVLALRVHLDDSTDTNGPLRVIPATHEIGVLTDAEIQQRAGATEEIACLVPVGGVVAMRPLIIHASSKSESDLPRRVLHIEYASKLEVTDELRLAIV